MRKSRNTISDFDKTKHPYLSKGTRRLLTEVPVRHWKPEVSTVFWRTL